MTKKDDKRRHDRFSAEDVQGNFSYSVRARVLNISMGGLAVRTQTQLTIGRKYRFRLGAQEGALELTASVRWCRLSGTERQGTRDIVPVYEAGLSFDDVLTDTAEDLLQFMEKNIILDLKKRIAGRFTVEAGGAVELESKSGFEVKQISLSGMMVESEVPMAPDTELELDMRLGRRKFTASARVIYMSEVEMEVEPQPQVWSEIDVDLDADADDDAEEVVENPQLYRMGIEFTAVPDDKRDLLENFIRNELDREEKPSGKKR